MSLRAPEKIMQEHRAMLDAGADGISTNTFGGTAAVMTHYDSAGLVRDVNLESARLARQAADEFSTSNNSRWVPGSIGPTLHLISIMGGGEDRVRGLREDYLVSGASPVGGWSGPAAR